MSKKRAKKRAQMKEVELRLDLRRAEYQIRELEIQLTRANAEIKAMQAVLSDEAEEKGITPILKQVYPLLRIVRQRIKANSFSFVYGGGPTAGSDPFGRQTLDDAMRLLLSIDPRINDTSQRAEKIMELAKAGMDELSRFYGVDFGAPEADRTMVAMISTPPGEPGTAVRFPDINPCGEISLEVPNRKEKKDEEPESEAEEG